MMRSIVSTAIETEQDVVVARQRARQIAALLGFDTQDQTRIATALSEIARNAFAYGGGGRVEFGLEDGTRQSMVMRVSDQGPGIANLDDILAGLYRSTVGMGLGIRGARRLMDGFDVETAPRKGTTVVMRKTLPLQAARVAPPGLKLIAAALAGEGQRDPLSEVRQQNRELMASLEALRQRQDELNQLNRELADTNRGVVALYAELDERAEQLKRANELKTRFLSDMTHEFRTPLNAIAALTGLMLARADGPLSAEQERQVTYIRQSANALSELVNDLLDIAKVEAGKTTVSASLFTVADLFGALRGMLRPLRHDDSVNLVFETPDAIPAIYGDERKIAQVLRNLISNALKFTERGEVRVTAALSAGGGRVVFAVRDTGIGIAPVHHAAIFEEFAQVENPLQNRAKGTGLGLALSRKLAALMDGSLYVESALGQGSTFYLEVPLAYRAPADAGVPSPAGRPGAHRVLIIDDDEVSRYSVRRALGALADVSEASSGFDGLRRAAAQRPDVILLDLRMPGMTGFEVLERLGQDPATRNIPVFIVSSALIQDQDRAKLARAAGVLAKEHISRETALALLSRVGRQAVETDAGS
jgi:signal transduction histidine kinase